MPRGLDGVLRVRGGPPPHVPAPSGLRKAHVSLRLHGTPFSARCTQIHCRSWTRRRRCISKPVVYLRHEDRTSHHRHPACHHLHRRRPLRPRAAAGDQQPGPPRTAPARAPSSTTWPRSRRAACIWSEASPACSTTRCASSATATRPPLGASAPCGCAPMQPDAREGLRDGSLTLSAAAELQWAFARQRRRGSISGTAAIAPAAAGSAAQNDPAADSAPAVPLPSAEPEPPPLVLDAVGRQKLVEEAAGKSARQVRQMLANLDPELAPPADRVRPLGDGRYELKAVIDAECQQGLEQLRGLLSHVDPRMSWGSLSDAWSRRGSTATTRAGHRAEPAAAVGPRTRRHTPRELRRRSRRTGAALRRTPRRRRRPTRTPARAASTSESQPAVVRRAASTTKDAAIPADAAPTPARAVRPIATSAPPPPSTQEETARRAATGAKPTSAATAAAKSCASGRAISAGVRPRAQLRAQPDRRGVPAPLRR